VSNTLEQWKREVDSSTQWVELAGGRRFAHLWTPKSQLKANVHIIHGLGEHGGRYIRLAPYLTRHGFQVSAIDLQGHGQSPGTRGWVTSYDSLLDDVQGGLEWSRQLDPDLPCFLFGHSMGANLVANYILRRKQLPTAAILSSPMFLSAREPKGLLNLVARLALKVMPRHTIHAGTETKQLMDDPVEQQMLDNDPLFHRRVSLRLGAALIDQGKWAIENAQQLSVPTLLTHGTLDKITLPEGSLQFADRAGSHCQIKLLEGHLHESFRDQRREQVIKIYVDFLNSLLCPRVSN
jgi:alpha-beta hydrolase superfamily lysophospholipase